MYIDEEGYLCIKEERMGTDMCGFDCTMIIETKYRVNRDGLFEEVKFAGND